MRQASSRMRRRKRASAPSPFQSRATLIRRRLDADSGRADVSDPELR